MQHSRLLQEQIFGSITKKKRRYGYNGIVVVGGILNKLSRVIAGPKADPVKISVDQLCDTRAREDFIDLRLDIQGYSCKYSSNLKEVT